MKRCTLAEGFTLLDLLELDPVGDDVFCNGVVFDRKGALYGGQVAAQALAAAGLTVDPERHPHSLHGYFLRAGRADRPMTLQVARDRDGRSFSARRVVAVQDGEVILNLSCSFAVPEEGSDNQLATAPACATPAEHLPRHTGMGLPTIEVRLPEQSELELSWPERMWARCVLPLPADPLLNACVLTYVSDMGSGLATLIEKGMRSTITLDHALWFHRPARLDSWVLMDLRPGSTASGRGWYTGSVYDEQGVHVASLVQETLFRRPRRP